MHEKYDSKFENQIILLAENKIKTGSYKIFDYQSRVIKKERLPELVEKGVTENEQVLVICNKEGETLVLTVEFQMMLRNALK